jgi:osmotically-inducible protein OsmY
MFKLKSVLSSLLIAIPLASLTLLSGCASCENSQSVMVGRHQCASYSSNKITDSIISRIQADNRINKLPIIVSTTCNRVVKLRGTVYTVEQQRLVLMIASHTPGVVLVSNGLLIRDPFINH